MYLNTVLLSLLAASSASAAAVHQPPSLCDKYSLRAMGNTTAQAEWAFMIKLVNTAVAGRGNYTTPNNNVQVDGVLNPGVYNGVTISLLEYFNASLVDSNIGPSAPIAMNWVDDGGEAPLHNLMPADHVQSNQESLVTHLYEFFGSILGCSAQGQGVFNAYAGHPSMFQVHQYMSLNTNQISYHNWQFRQAAVAMGFTASDADTFFGELQYLFNARCSPPATIVPANGAQFHSVCTNAACPVEVGSNCTGYTRNGVFPKPAAAPSGGSG